MAICRYVKSKLIILLEEQKKACYAFIMVKCHHSSASRGWRTKSEFLCLLKRCTSKMHDVTMTSLLAIVKYGKQNKDGIEGERQANIHLGFLFFSLFTGLLKKHNI